MQYLNAAADPFNGPRLRISPGTRVCCRGSSRTPAPPPGPRRPTISRNSPPLIAGSQKTKYYWVCLRRPANPFAPVSAANPMLVVDAMRFPYIDGTAPLTGQGPKGGPPTVPNLTATKVNTVYSAQRFQPYRGGHAVPVAAATPAQRYLRSRRWMPATATPNRSRRRRDIPTSWGRRGSTTSAPRTTPRRLTTRPTRSTTPWASPTTRPSRGITCRFTTAISPAWPS